MSLKKKLENHKEYEKQMDIFIKKRFDSEKNSSLERIKRLLDKNSFSEIDMFVKHRCEKLKDKTLPREGVVTGYGTINNRQVVVFSQDFSVLGGSLGEYHAKKICKVQKLAERFRVPIIGIVESGGARIQEGIDSLNGYANVIYNNTILSGLIPQITIVVGPSAGGSSYSAGLTDFIFMIKNKSKMFITGSKVIKVLTGEKINDEELGGSEVHSKISGVSQIVTKNEEECMNKVRELLSYLPSNCYEPVSSSFYDRSKENIIAHLNSDTFIKKNTIDDEILEIIPDNPKKAFDMKSVINLIMDKNDFFEVYEYYAKNIITGFSRIKGITVGIIANQPTELAGAIDNHASIKAARFIRFCDSFNIPILTFVDNPGFWPGKNEEHHGIIRNGAKLLYAYSEATVPKITINIRKAFGGGYIAMCSKGLGADMVFAWPTSEIAVMGPKGSAKIVLDKTKNISTENLDKAVHENTYKGVERGFIDTIIDPRETRISIIRTLTMLLNNKSTSIDKKHGNIPL